MLKGKAYAITGANTGVGRATAIALANRGALVVLLCRSAERAANVLAEIEGGPGAAELIVVDLGVLSSVRQAAATLAERVKHLDALINNAGVGGARGRTEDGFELAFGVNYLGHYLLTRLLLNGPVSVARIVHVSSGAHEKVARLDLSRVEGETRSLTGIDEYALSKLCVMLFHHELARRLSRPEDPISLAADPGDVASDAYRHVPFLMRPFVVCGMKSPHEGARTSVHCATSASPSFESGACFVDERLTESSALARDPFEGRALWDKSAAYVGLPS